MLLQINCNKYTLVKVFLRIICQGTANFFTFFRHIPFIESNEKKLFLGTED
jgi:hypothetical protein